MQINHFRFSTYCQLLLITLSGLLAPAALAQTMPGGESPSSERSPSPAVTGSSPWMQPLTGNPVPEFPEAYVLGPGDRIQIDIFNIPEFSGSENGVHEVLGDGTLSLPMIGVVDVQGLTLEQTQQVLTQRYATLLTRPPQLTVTLLQTRPIRIAIAGEIHRPGTYTADPNADAEGNSRDTGRQWPTLTQVIQQAGGITQQADIRTVEIRRPRRQAADAVMVANLWDLIRYGDIEQDIRLRDGDTVVISKVVSPSPGESVAISSANFSPSEMSVQVVGEVVQPGTVALPANATLNQAILAAGGFQNSRARTSSVDLVRLNPDGSVEQRTLEVDLAVAANEDNNPILRPNDVVMVNRNTVASASDALGVFLNPLTAITAVLRLFGL